MQGILFKQRYKPVNIPSTPVLNRKHVSYIATRFGAVHNDRCSFGLFGKLPDMSEIDSIYFLEKAKDAITDVSKRRTIYRAILSLDHETAVEKGYYNRSAWENLLQSHISTIAKEMNIDARAMSWVAAYHHERGHPHVHIMYWDNSRKIRQEFIPKERFEVMTDKIKAAINRDLFGEEIREAQTHQKAGRDAIQLELQALFQDMNLADALNLHQVKPAQLTQLGEQLRDLFLDMPQSGRLAYKFLPPEYKKQLNTCIDGILQISGFRKLEQELIRLRDNVGTLYGNSAARKDAMRADERARLHTDMGNTILKYLASCRTLLSEDIFGSGSQDLHDLQQMAEQLLSESPVLWLQYTALIGKDQNGESLPQQAFKEQLHELSIAIREDMRIRTAIYAYAEKQETPEGIDKKAFRRKLYARCYSSIEEFLKRQLAGQLVTDGRAGGLIQLRRVVADLLQISTPLKAEYQALLQHMPQERTPFSEIMQGNFADQFEVLCNKIRKDIRVQIVTDAYILSQETTLNENEQTSRKQYYTECYREISKLLIENLKTDAGYPEQALRSLALDLLMHLFQMTSQGVNHQRSQRLYDRYQRERSKAAQKDYLNEKAQDSGWAFE